MELEIIRGIVADILGVDKASIKDKTSFRKELCANSLELFQILLRLEEEFDIETDDESVKDIDNVNDVFIVLKTTIRPAQ